MLSNSTKRLRNLNQINQTITEIMKKRFYIKLVSAIFLFVALSSVNSLGQIVYTYDANGNRTSRTLTGQRSAAPLTFPLNAKQFKSLNNKESKAKEELTTLESSINVYPNPTSGILRIAIENYYDPLRGKYQLFNLGGAVLKQSVIDSPDTEINMSKMQNGMYVLRITLNGAVVDYKIIKQN